MKNFFQIITGFFFFLTILVGLFLLRGEIIFSDQAYSIIKNILIPGYLLLTGLMIGGFFATIKGRQSVDQSNIYTKSFIIGIIIGVILALAYMFI